ncbi:MAG TPA: glycosyltransferase family 39 protein [Acidisarcina sp.]
MPPLSESAAKGLRVALVAAFLLAMALQLVHVTRATSSTWDEPHHLLDGYTVWKLYDYRLNPEVPPLVKLTAALPLLGEQLTLPPNQGRSSSKEAFLDGRAFVFGNGADRTLVPARLACMMFTLALGWLIYVAAGEMFGCWAGLFALALYVFDPNFLAHGALVTTDAGSACCIFAAVYAFYRYCRKPSWAALLLTGVAAGLSLAAKFTGIFVFPILCLLAAWEAVLARSSTVLLKRLAALAAAGVCGFLILWAFYGFRYEAAPMGQQMNPTLAGYLDRMYDQADARHLATLARYRVLPEAYIWGLENTKQTEFEDTSYFWGKVYRHGNWEYFPVAFLIKSTLPFLIMLVLGGLAFAWGLRTRKRELGFLLIPVLIYFGFAMHSDMDIGARHLLPIYPFLYVLTAGAAYFLFAWDRRWAFALGALLGWQIVTSARVGPAYMAYGNEAWGGPSEVHRYLSDANVDWGQQLKDVKAYLDSNHITNCWFDYFPDGAIEPSDYGINCKRLPTTSGLWWLDLPTSVPPGIDGTVLISDGNLEGIEFGDGPLNPLDSFRGMRPEATIDHGVYVYSGRFPVPLASAIVTAHEAQKLLAAGRVDEALTKAQSAVQLAPDSVPVLTAYAEALTASGRREQALEQYRKALRSAQTVRPDLQAGLAADLQKRTTSLEASVTAR